jgi:methionyl-tRNA synthetase
VVWPAILLGVGDLVLPYNIVSSEFLTMEGRQFSSSRSHVIFVRDFLTRYDADTLRFYLTIAGPEARDTDFTWAEFVRRNNDELVGTWGNLVHRTLIQRAP